MSFSFIHLSATSFKPFRAVCVQNVLYHKKINTVGKRGSMLAKLVTNHDTNKKWHLSLMNAPKKGKNIFAKVHRPARRSHVLNSLFIKNITDVLSTGDVAPEVMGHGIEITGVKVTIDCQIINVFWQIPANKFDSSADIQHMLACKAPQIRSELISRNILGKVPKIYFVRDSTNERAAEFEKALEIADLGPVGRENIVTDQDFLKKKKLYIFTSVEDTTEISRSDASEKKKITKDINQPPPNPEGMVTNVLGLDHDFLMNRVMISKKKEKLPEEAPEAPSTDNHDDLFSKVRGTPLNSTDRDKILKQFHLDRKIELQERRKLERDIESINYDLYTSEEPKFHLFLDEETQEQDYYDEENY